MSYECAVCGAETSRGTLLLSDGRWIATPLCALHKMAVADVQPKGTLVIDQSKPN